MDVLIGCEYSGVVREAFRARGHNAYSCDLIESEDGSPFHFQCDITEILRDHKHMPNVDLLIAHPPCTDLAVSGSRWFVEKQKDGRQEDALDFVFELMACGVKRWAIENPVSIISGRITKPDQVIQPWQFGHKEKKATCLWLHGLPKLTPTDIVGPPPKEMTPEETRSWNRVWLLPPGPNRWKERSRTFTGIAQAMADQWGSLSG